jgi:acetyl esterase
MTKQLDPVLAMALAQMAESGQPEIWQLPPEEARAMFSAMTPMFEGPAPEMHQVEDRTIPGPGGPLPLRIYTPRSMAEGELAPILVYFHGGGWVLGDLDTHDVVCRHLAREGDCIVVSVDYRLAPEHKFPAAIEDALAAPEWASAHAESIHGDAGRLAVGGASAGGNLAAVVSQLAKEQGRPPIRFQMLLYPAVDLATERPSRAKYGEGYFLTQNDMLWFAQQYLDGSEDPLDPRLAPLHHPDLSGLPPALIVTAGFDPLQDEGKAYAEALEAAGVPVEYVHFDDMIHGFISMPGILERGRQGLAQCATALRNALVA